MFIHVASNLNKDQKQVVHDLGFFDLLGMSSTHVPPKLLHWLIKHFDCTTKTLHLPNGFSFSINPSCVRKILGIPLGGLPIQNSGSLEAYQSISSEISCEGETPSVQELCNIITDDLVGHRFARVFMLLALSSFLCPNTRAVCSTRYYPPLVTVYSIKDRDWCSFVLEWMVSYIMKFKAIPEGEESLDIGGCCHVLMVQ